jgi:hypothetical protein
VGKGGEMGWVFGRMVGMDKGSGEEGSSRVDGFGGLRGEREPILSNWQYTDRRSVRGVKDPLGQLGWLPR